MIPKTLDRSVVVKREDSLKNENNDNSSNNVIVKPKVEVKETKKEEKTISEYLQEKYQWK